MSTPPSRFAIPKPRRDVLVAGATGLVGQALIETLLSGSAVGNVHALVRAEQPHWKRRTGVMQHVVSYPSGLGALPHADDAYCCLGTTIKTAGSQAAFRAVDFDAVVAFARAARAAGATRIAIVSALGASASSRVFYNRVKGEAEQAVHALGFSTLVIARPSLLLGDRAVLGQPTRPIERLAAALSAPLGWLLPQSVRPIEAQTVARAMVQAMQQANRGTYVLESGDLQVMARMGATLDV
jgi:uncharacterized protein YbjT (DUF2867 family)